MSARCCAAQLVVAVGVVGYAAPSGPEYSWFDALYSTVITLTTVGYEETIDFTRYPAARGSTVALLVVGVGSFLYFISNLTAFLVEGTLDHPWVRRKMEKQIAKLSRHEIVCGVGGMGVHVVRELLDTGRAFVLVEADVERLDAVRAEIGNFPAVVGDATSDDVLLAAGIERAMGLVTCVSNDRDNLVVTLSARPSDGGELHGRDAARTEWGTSRRGRLRRGRIGARGLGAVTAARAFHRGRAGPRPSRRRRLDLQPRRLRNAERADSDGLHRRPGDARPTRGIGERLRATAAPVAR